jgi:hypothetical protein
MALTVAAGEKVLADHINRLVPLFARKTGDETITSNATLQNDNDLAVAVVASVAYQFQLRAVINSGTTPDFKMGWTFPAGLTMTYDLFEGETLGTAANVIQGPYVQTDVPPISTTGSDQPWIARGLVIVSTTAGTLQWQWAQNTLTASNTIVRTGSYLLLNRLT